MLRAVNVEPAHNRSTTPSLVRVKDHCFCSHSSCVPFEKVKAKDRISKGEKNEDFCQHLSGAFNLKDDWGCAPSSLHL
ncbi:hypothetical protein NDU88_004610 [Pleurodeles waltl]|uniref:Uncharacterized protein n=1 Tax=Pleurodeles waltl TaxID=8319 RepID=A0AAV7SJE8_PLEWA|nr:hypothetical protein NDU88_004610 [Pleurodeles waltl]